MWEWKKFGEEEGEGEGEGEGDRVSLSVSVSERDQLTREKTMIESWISV